MTGCTFRTDGYRPEDPVQRELRDMRAQLAEAKKESRILRARLDRVAIYALVDAERERQEKLHGGKTIADRLPLLEKMAILAEEAGEVAKAGLDMKNLFGAGILEDLREGETDDDGALGRYCAHLKEELVQLAACCVAWLEAKEL